MRPTLLVAPLALATVVPTTMLALLVATLLAALLTDRPAIPVAPTLAPLATIAMPACAACLRAVATCRPFGRWAISGGGCRCGCRCSVLILPGGTMRARLSAHLPATLSATSATALARLAVVGAMPARPPDLYDLRLFLNLRLAWSPRLGRCLFGIDLGRRSNVRYGVGTCRHRRLGGRRLLDGPCRLRGQDRKSVV